MIAMNWLKDRSPRSSCGRQLSQTTDSTTLSMTDDVFLGPPQRLYERNNSRNGSHRRMPVQHSVSSPHLAICPEAICPEGKFIFPPDRPTRLDMRKTTRDDAVLPSPTDPHGGFFTPRETLRRHISNSSIPQMFLNGAGEPAKQERNISNRKSSTVSMNEIYAIDKPMYEKPPSRARFVETDKPRRPSSQVDGYLDVAKLQLKKMSEQINKAPLTQHSRLHGASVTSLNDPSRGFGLSQTPPMAAPPPSNHHHHTLSPVLHTFSREHRGELDMAEKYNYDLSKAQLKASSRTSALLAGFAMVALVELQYDNDTPRPLLILLGVVTSLLVSVHLLALMMSTCILPYMEATGCTQDSPHLRLKFYIDLSWLFSTCIGLLLFLVEIGIIFFVKFDAVGYRTAGYITTAMLVPVVVIFIVFSYLIHKSRVSHSLGRFKHKVDTMKQFLDVEAQMAKPSMAGVVKDI